MNIEKINIAIKRLINFPDSALYYESGLTLGQLEEAENKLDLKFPDDFKYFYSKINGFSLIGGSVFPIVLDDLESKKRENLIRVNHREHFEVVNPMPKYFLPFSPNGRGDHYCLDLKTLNDKGTCGVIFWQWDYSFFNMNKIEKVNDSFTNWLIELIEEAEEDLEDEI